MGAYFLVAQFKLNFDWLRFWDVFGSEDNFEGYKNLAIISTKSKPRAKKQPCHVYLLLFLLLEQSTFLIITKNNKDMTARRK